MDASSAFAGWFAKAFQSKETRLQQGRPNCRVPNAAGTAGAQRIRLIRGYRNLSGLFVKIRRDEYPVHVQQRVSEPVRLRGNGILESSQMPEPSGNLPDLS
jgi:hypothetical protein